jgi:hypothetical protein
MNIIFTKHAKEQMEERGISEDEVVNTLKYPENVQKADNLYYARKRTGQGIIEVVYEKQNYIKVITLYPL